MRGHGGNKTTASEAKKINKSARAVPPLMAPALVNKRHHLFVRINLMCISGEQNYRKLGSQPLPKPGKVEEVVGRRGRGGGGRRGEERRGSLK